MDNNFYYSKTTCSFFNKDVNDDAIPDDAVLITEEEHFELLNGIASGYEIYVKADGLPGLRVPELTFEHKCSNERRWRDLELQRADIELNKVQDGDIKASGTVSQWRSYRKALREWPSSDYFPDKTKRPNFSDF